jgi:3-isopropylmalate dehydrogenase
MSNAMTVAVLPGDGIGRETVPQALKVLRALERTGLQFDLRHGLIGSAAVEAGEAPLPQRTLDLARASGAILFGAVGDYGNDKLPRSQRAGSGLLRLRKELGLFANFRPAKLFPELIGASSLRPEIVEGMDLVILRELNGDLYFGEPRGVSTLPSGERVGVNTMRYTESEIERIAHAGFRMARRRRRKLCSVDKANVLETMVLWREVVTRLGREYPDVELSHLYVDAAAMSLLRNPRQFDVIVTGNVFGDILSDEAAMLTGSLGMLPSASLGDGTLGLYEPVHGSAPDIAGKDVANPLGTILSAAMMLRHSFGLDDAAEQIEQAVRRVLADGFRTADIRQDGTRLLGTEAMGDAVAAALH